MPVKKRVAKSREHRITPEAVEAFVEGDELALHRALGLRPWEPSPLLIEIEGPCPECYGAASAYGAAWPKVRELRRALQRASRQ